ncbi:MAG: FimV family protein [Aquabacterium sp.]
MMHFNKVSAAVLAGVALGLVPVASHGLGFGRPVSRAILGERLQMQVPVRLEAGEDLTPECLVGDVYVGDDKLAASAVAVTVDRAVGGSEATLRLQTRVSVNEPVVTVYLAAGCQARVTRKFVLFVDPPSLATEAAAVPAPVLPDVAPLAGGAPADAGGERAAPPRRTAARGAASAPARAPVVRSPAPAGEPPAAVVATPRTPGLSTSLGAKAPEAASRLVLDPVEQDALVLPQLQISQTLVTSAVDDSPAAQERRAAAAALWQALNATPEQLARDRQRLTELEQRLVSLQAEGDKARAALAQAREERGPLGELPAWVTLALVGLVAVLLPLVAWLGLRLWRSYRKEAASDWMTSAMAQEPRETGVDDDLSRTSVDFVRRPAPEETPVADTYQASLSPASSLGPESAPSPFQPASVFQSEAPSSALDDMSLAPAAAPTPSGVTLSSPVHREALREVSVEELIDLEQQAEFFVVLGQDDAAIDLLEGHVQSTTGASPLPYLKLLEIYQRLGQRADYERVQTDFNARFNGYAPAWESDLQHGHTLGDYPGVVERIQSLWPTPARAMELLEKSLTRPDHDAETFDLPAYRELLFLYAVARDLSERDVRDRQAVDLLLPEVGASHAELLTDSGAGADDIEPLMATRPVKAQPEASPTISLDLHLDDLTAPVPSAGPAQEARTGHTGLTLEPLPFHADGPTEQIKKA